jgi:hypothetical protein
MALWNTRPQLPWQTPAYYAQEEAALTPDEFRRLHRNEWATASNPFVPYEWWETCMGDVPTSPTVTVAMDASVSGDDFGMVAVSVHRTDDHDDDNQEADT